MKITAILDDKLIEDAMKYSNSSSITDALRAALKEYIALQKLKELSQLVKKSPLQFDKSADEIRRINREL